MTACYRFCLSRVAQDRRGTQARSVDGGPDQAVRDPRGRTDRTERRITRVTLAIEPTAAAIVQRIFEMYAAGMCYTRIAKRLNDDGVLGAWGGSWAGSAIREMLRNDVYCGIRVYGRTKKIKTAHGTRSKRPRPEAARTLNEGAHPTLIDPPLWERVQTRREAVAKAYRESGNHFRPTRSVQTQFLLTGLLKCGVCGANFATRVAHTRRGGGRYFYSGVR
jgi:site-specific DNA recombinase